MKRINTIIGIGAATIISITAAIPVFRNVHGRELDLNGKESCSIYAYNETNIADIVTDETAQSTTATAAATEEPKAEKYPYMSYIPDVYDPDMSYEEVEKHLTNESIDAFEDPYIREEAEQYSEYKLINAEYAVKYYGQGFGFGDYAFTNGFSFKDNPDDTWFVFDIVKSSQEDFDAFMEEFTKDNIIEEYNETDKYISFCTDSSQGTYYEITFYKDKELLCRETYFF